MTQREKYLNHIKNISVTFDYFGTYIIIYIYYIHILYYTRVIIKICLLHKINGFYFKETQRNCKVNLLFSTQINILVENQFFFYLLPAFLEYYFTLTIYNILKVSFFFLCCYMSKTIIFIAICNHIIYTYFLITCPNIRKYNNIL